MEELHRVPKHGFYSLYSVMLSAEAILTSLESDREVCSNCYRKSIIWIPQEEMIPSSASTSIEQMVADGRFPGKESEICYPTVGKDRFGSGVACKCGVVDTYTKIRPLTKERTLDCTPRIIRRLEERGLDVDEDEFYDVVRSMKEDPSVQFDDREIFLTAIEDSINNEEVDS